jgi:hypothetical protein
MADKKNAPADDGADEMSEPAVEQPEEGAAPGQLPDEPPATEPGPPAEVAPESAPPAGEREPVEHFGEAHLEVDLSNGERHPLEQPAEEESAA